MSGKGSSGNSRGNNSSDGSDGSDGGSEDQVLAMVGEGKGPWALSPLLYPVLARCDDPLYGFDQSLYD
jgi:hypothetical protein